MSGITAGDKGEVDNDVGCGGREDEEDRVKKRGAIRTKSRKKDDFSDELELEKVEEDSSVALVVSSGERKRTKRKLNLDVEIAGKKKKEKGKAKKNIQIEDATSGRACLALENDDDDDDEEDLTVEDLLIFAKECIQEEKDIGAQEVVPMKENISVEKQFGDTLQSKNTINLEEVNKRWSKEEETETYKPSMSGNPTQDMLDLFLGPLLKKTREKEKKVDLTTEEIDFDLEMSRRQNKPGEELANVAVAKKKSSLKDRVAMFLD